MDENMIIKIYWKNEGESFFIESTTTLKKAKELGANWINDVENGSTYLIKDYPKSVNPGTLIIIANVK